MIATVVSSGNKYSSPTLVVIVDVMDARAISPVFPQDDPILLRVNEWVPDSSVVNGNNY